MLNIIEGPEAVTRMVKQCITKELTEDGILSDVEMFIYSLLYILMKKLSIL